MKRLLILLTGNAALFGSSIPHFIADNNAFTFSKVLEPHALECCDYSLWADVFANFASFPGAHFHTEGVVLGYDRCCGSALTYGIGAGYSRNHYRKGRIVSLCIAPYATAYFSDFYMEGKLLYAYNRIKNEESNFHINQLMPHLGFGYDYCCCSTIFEPFAMFDWVFNNHSSMLRSEVGLRIYKCWDCLVLKAVGGYVNKAPFKMDFHNQNLGTWGISALLKNNCGFFGMLSYDGEAGSGYLANLVQLTLGKDF